MITVSSTYTTADLYENGPGKESSVEDCACVKGRKKIRKLKSLR